MGDLTGATNMRLVRPGRSPTGYVNSRCTDNPTHYDNGSSSPELILSALRPFGSRAAYVWFPGDRRQTDAYDDALRKAGGGGRDIFVGCQKE